MTNNTTDPFQAIADPNRREILMLLGNEQLSINAIAENFDISRPAVSKHVKVLYEAGFITIREQGRERYCQLRPEGFNEVKQWLEFFEAFWAQKLKKLGTLLDQRAIAKKNKH